ncbi:MAG: cyclic nucleotide-binding domain-containing protein [Syntrophobacterales bacterium]|jgi:CRP-like cAMP-binding protein
MVEANELARFYLFSIFSKEQLEEIAEITEKKTYKKHDHVYERGDRAKHLFVVNEGLVSLRRFEPGDDVGIAFEMRESGGLFGAASFMHPQHYTLTAVCLEDAEVMAIDADKLSALCEKDTAVGYNLMLKIAQVYFERYKTAKRNLYGMVQAPTVIKALPG